MSGEFFKQKGWKSHAKWMTDTEYSRALDSLVFATTDIIIRDRAGRFVFAKRAAEPMNDWWIIGGRMRPGESGIESAMRNFKRETGICPPKKRFRFVGVYGYSWARRAQKPKDHGCSGVSLTYTAVLSESEIQRIALDKQEYDGTQIRLSPKQVFSYVKKRKLHPALGVIVSDALALKR